MAVILDSGKHVPFLRGMLTHYLLEQGLSFKEAYEVSDRLRKLLSRQKTVSARKMVQLVHDTAREVFGDRPIGDGVFWAPRSRQILVGEEGASRPFSREHLARSLAVAGIEEEQAYALAERIVGGFLQASRTVVSRTDVRKAAADLLRREYGRTYAERYDVWHDFRAQDQPQPMVILIGGASGVGKTSVGVALANILQISRVTSTDEIRQVMRLMISRDLMPTLHTSSYAAFESVDVPLPEGADPVTQAYREQAARVCVGVRATIERAIEENVSLIVDGVHLLPDLVGTGAYQGRAHFIWANLFIEDEEAFAARFRQRGREASRRPQHRYLRYLRQIVMIQKHILEVGEAHGVPAFENTVLEETVQSICMQIMDVLRLEALRKERKERP